MLHIKVVGPGCANCEKLAKLCQEVVIENELEGQVEKVTDRNRFAELGVMLTPALIVNGTMLSSGKIPTKHTLAHWLAEQAEKV
ncbi:MAG: thioredoxin family protein [Calditrichaeota bacterium]|nr:thioredoxin family protein [Calditrichota bacterium]MCB0305244.1 thioredoxin family protein [Calditrichota bacterium]MCB0315886.1 thioredoxin family protein [Calditrichota bacterium]MCB9089684.1 thioredoxin family protein [Calditrichia bacterium]